MFGFETAFLLVGPAVAMIMIGCVADIAVAFVRRARDPDQKDERYENAQVVCQGLMFVGALLFANCCFETLDAWTAAIDEDLGVAPAPAPTYERVLRPDLDHGCRGIATVAPDATPWPPLLGAIPTRSGA